MENQGLRVNLMAVGQTQKQEVNADSAQQLPVTMSKYIRLLILMCEEHARSVNYSCTHSISFSRTSCVS